MQLLARRYVALMATEAVKKQLQGMSATRGSQAYFRWTLIGSLAWVRLVFLGILLLLLLPRRHDRLLLLRLLLLLTLSSASKV